MRNKRKLFRFISIIALGCAVLFIAIKLILDLPFRRGLPGLPDVQSLSAPLKEQISDASARASLRPTSDNIGKLGMVYHSSAYYDKAAQ